MYLAKIVEEQTAVPNDAIAVGKPHAAADMLIVNLAARA